MSFTQQVGNPNATYPPSLTLAQSANGVGVVSIGSDVKYVTFNPIPAYSWIPLSTNPYENYFFEWYTGTDFEGDYYEGYTPDFATFNALNVRSLGFYYDNVPRLSGIVNLDQYPNLDTLSLEYYDGDDISFLFNLPSNLYYLDLYDLPNIQNEQFNTLFTLLSNYGQLGAFGIEGVASLKDASIKNNSQLQQIFLNGNQLTAVTLENLPQVRQLSLFNNQLSAITLPDLPQVRQLSLFNNQLSAITLPDLPQLQGLYLNSNRLSAIVKTNLPPLFVLRAEDNQLTYVDITGLSAQIVEFRNNNLPLSAVNHIAVQCDLNGMTNCYLSLVGGTNSPLSGDGIIAKDNLITKGWTVVSNT